MPEIATDSQAALLFAWVHNRWGLLVHCLITPRTTEWAIVLRPMRYRDVEKTLFEDKYES